MWIIDRIEPPFAVCEQSETGEWRNLPLDSLPAVREGDVLRESAEGFCVDEDETRRRRKKNAARMKRLFH